MRDDDFAARLIRSFNTDRMEHARAGDFVVAARVIGLNAGIDDHADGCRRDRMRTLPRAGEIRGCTGSHQRDVRTLGNLLDRGNNFVRQLRDALVHHHHAVSASGQSDITACTSHQVDVALHMQQLHLLGLPVRFAPRLCVGKLGAMRVEASLYSGLSVNWAAGGDNPFTFA